MHNSVEISYRYYSIPFIADYSTDLKFIFNYILTDDEFVSYDTIDEHTSGWTTQEILEILKNPDYNHPAFRKILPGTVDIDTVRLVEQHSPNASPLTTEDSIHGEEPRTTKTSIHRFFNTKEKTAGVTALLADIVFIVGLAIAGLLTAQHLAFIMIGLATTTALASAGAYLLIPNQNHAF